MQKINELLLFLNDYLGGHQWFVFFLLGTGVFWIGFKADLIVKGNDKDPSSFDAIVYWERGYRNKGS